MGAAIGSFLNVLIDRLPAAESIGGRSHCDSCKKTLSALDLLPILSFLFLGGKCRYCKKKLSWYYPFVEALTGVVFVLIWFLTPSSPYEVLRLVHFIGASALIVTFFADVKYHIIPDSMQIILFICSLLLLAYQGLDPNIFLWHVIAAFVVMLPILIIHLATRGKGMGFADVKLAFIIGFYFGIPAGLAVLYFGFVSGAVVGIPLVILGKRGMKSKIAFGPFLVSAIIFVYLYQNQLLQYIKKIYGF